VPIRELSRCIAALGGRPHGVSSGFLFYGFATYGSAQAGCASRNDANIYVSLRARFLGAMFDRDTLVITL
jgi:hypothetical protein